MSRPKNGIMFNVLIEKEKEYWLAHCLELDIVTTGSTAKQVEKEMTDLISTQLDYAFSNDNLDNLYRPAPAEVWKKFYACDKPTEKIIEVKSDFRHAVEDFVPPWFIAKKCQVPVACHA